MKIYRYKNNRKTDGTYSRAHFIIMNDSVYKLSGCDEYVIGSYDIDVNDLEPTDKEF